MRYLFLFFLSVVFSGCATKPTEPTIVVKTVYKVAPFPQTLLEPCGVTLPPNTEYYIKLDDVQKEDTLVRYSQSLLTDIEKCNSQLRQLNKINTEYRTLFSSEHNSKP